MSNWIGKAIEHPGALTKQAKKVGESPMEFAAAHEDSPGVTGKRARLAETLAGLREKKKTAAQKSALRGMK